MPLSTDGLPPTLWRALHDPQAWRLVGDFFMHPDGVTLEVKVMTLGKLSPFDHDVVMFSLDFLQETRRISLAECLPALWLAQTPVRAAFMTWVWLLWAQTDEGQAAYQQVLNRIIAWYIPLDPQSGSGGQRWIGVDNDVSAVVHAQTREAVPLPKELSEAWGQVGYGLRVDADRGPNRPILQIDDRRTFSLPTSSHALMEKMQTAPLPDLPDWQLIEARNDLASVNEIKKPLE